MYAAFEALNTQDLDNTILLMKMAYIAALLAEVIMFCMNHA
jgi:hypothetical protein